MRISLRKWDLLTLLFAYIYIFVFYLYFKVDWSTIFYSFISGTISSLLVIYVFHKVEKSYSEDKFSMASLGLIIAVTYSYISCIKFATNILFDGFIYDLNERFIGTLYIDLIIFITANIWSKWNRRRKPNKFSIHDMEGIKFPKKFLYIASILYLAIIVINYITNRNALTFSNPNSSNDATFIELYKFFDQILLCMVVLNIKIGNVRKILSYKGVLPLMILLLSFSIKAMQTGKRNELVLPILIITMGLIALKKMKVYTFQKIIALVPLFLMFFSIIIFKVSGRFDYYSQMIFNVLVYRFDLSDFACTIASRANSFHYSINSILDGAKMAIPGFIYNGKEAIKTDGQYIYVLKSIGLDYMNDYNDTLFSVGAEIGGYLGMAIVFPVYIFFCEFIDNRLSKNKIKGTILKVLSMRYFGLVECTWLSLISDTRNLLIYILIGYYLISFFVYSGKKTIINHVETL